MSPAPAFLAAFRSRFPLLGSRVYVNACSQGAASLDVEAALAEFRDSWMRDGSPWERWIEEVDALRREFASFVGADADEIAVVSSASAGIGAVASALSFSGPRHTVVVGEFEFPTMAQIWLAQQPRGARLAWARARGQRLDASTYADLVDERTLVVPVTHVSFRNGFRLDVPAIVAAAHARGALVFLDDYQRSGAGVIDVHTLGVDFMVTGVYKYLLGPAGIAFLYVRRDLVERLTPTATGWFGRVNPFQYATGSLDWPAAARRFEAGTPAVLSAYGARAALALLASLPAADVEAHIGSLVRRLRDGAAAAGYVLLTPDEPQRSGPLTVVASRDAPELVRRLQARGVICSVRDHGVRVAFHAYNNESDVDAVLDALAREEALVEKTAGRGLSPHGHEPARP